MRMWFDAMFKCEAADALLVHLMELQAECSKVIQLLGYRGSMRPFHISSATDRLSFNVAVSSPV